MALTKRLYKNHQTVITAENMNDIQDAIIALEALAGIVPGEGEATRNISVVNPNGNFTLVETVGLPDGLYWFDNPVTFKDDTQTETFQLSGLVAKTENGWLNYDNGRACITDEFGVLIAWTYTSLPEATSENEGKVLAVVEGKWEVAEPQQVFPLEEAHVYPTNEPQELLPSDGYCGFSVIYVDAAPDSGGGDYPGGDYPDDGDDDYPDGGDSVILPDVNDNEYGSEENYTGYSYYNLALLPTFPAEELVENPYALLSWDEYEEHYTMYLSPGPFRVQSSAGLDNPIVTGRGPGSSGTPLNTSQRYDQVGGTWSKRGSMAAHGFHKEDIFWANHTICYDHTGEPFYYGFSAIPQVSKDSSGTEQYAKVSESEMNALAISAQNITGTTETMNMRQVITELDEYAAQPKAEELTY